MKDGTRVLEIVSYRDFYDVPQIFLARDGDRIYLFDCKFDDSIDDYQHFYSVHLMPAIEEMTLDGSWANLASAAVKNLGSVEKKNLEFDSTQRASVKVLSGWS